MRRIMTTEPPKPSSRWLTPLRTVWDVGVDSFGALVVPRECPICEAYSENDTSSAPFCLDCRAELIDAAGQICSRCAMTVGPFARRDGGCGECRGRSLGFDAAVALAPYQGPVRELCLKLKHLHNSWMAPWMADVLLEARPELREQTRNALVAPIPLHWWRHWQRGYNQAEELSMGLARRLGLSLVNPLRRVISTGKLAGLGRTERAKLLRNAFAVRKTSARVLEGRTVVLVDDILTTGATCGAAARALKRAGAKRVIAVVIARAEWKRN